MIGPFEEMTSGRYPHGHRRARAAFRTPARADCPQVAATDMQGRRQAARSLRGAPDSGTLSAPFELASPRAASDSRRRRRARSFPFASSTISKSPGRFVAEERLEADRVDEIGMGAGLRQDELLNDAEALTPLGDLDVEPRRGVVDLRRHALGPGREGQPESLGVGDVLWVAHPVVEDVPDDGHSNGPAERQDFA